MVALHIRKFYKNVMKYGLMGLISTFFVRIIAKRSINNGLSVDNFLECKTTFKGDSSFLLLCIFNFYQQLQENLKTLSLSARCYSCPKSISSSVISLPDSWASLARCPFVVC